LECAKSFGRRSQPYQSIIENANIIINNQPTDGQLAQFNQEAQQL